MKTGKATALFPQIIIQYTITGQELTTLVNQFPFLIGRDSSAVHLVLPHGTVSRIHAQLICRESTILLENISTTNRTTVNGRYIDSPTEISAGDKVAMGACQLVFKIV